MKSASVIYIRARRCKGFNLVHHLWCFGEIFSPPKNPWPYPFGFWQKFVFGSYLEKYWSQNVQMQSWIVRREELYPIDIQSLLKLKLKVLKLKFFCFWQNQV